LNLATRTKSGDAMLKRDPVVKDAKSK